MRVHAFVNVRVCVVYVCSMCVCLHVQWVCTCTCVYSMSVRVCDARGRDWHCLCINHVSSICSAQETRVTRDRKARWVVTERSVPSVLKVLLMRPASPSCLPVLPRRSPSRVLVRLPVVSKPRCRRRRQRSPLGRPYGSAPPGQMSPNPPLEWSLAPSRDSGFPGGGGR